MKKQWFAIMLLAGTLFHASPAHAQDQTSVMPSSSSYDGPWGSLNWQEFVIEPPDHFIEASPDLQKPDYQTVWQISSGTIEQVRDILHGAGLSNEQVEVLTNDDHLVAKPGRGMVEISPPEEIIMALHPEQRAKLYPLFDPKTKDNPFFSPYVLPLGGIEAVTDSFQTPVPREQIQLIHDLSYNFGMVPLLSDINLVLDKAGSAENRFQVLQLLNRDRALSLTLKVNSNQSLGNLVNYWSAQGRNTDFIPLLESVISSRIDNELDIIHLLPPVPRKLLNTYPEPNGDIAAGFKPNCFWTALNFFEDSPANRYFDTVDQIIRERYTQTRLTREFGDLVLITDSATGNFLHACNIVAGDLVFTKNGNSLRKPWIISRLDDVVQSYTKDRIDVHYFRLKPGS